MRFLIPLLILLTLYFLIACESENIETRIQKDELYDDLNNVFNSDTVPSRIISLAPNLTEFIYELGFEENLIGNTLYCNYPEEAKSITKVGDLLTIDLEKIVTLKPDMIFITVEGNTKDNYTKLVELGYSVFVSNPRDFKGIVKTTYDLAKIFNVEEKAKNKVALWQESITRVVQNSKDSPPRRAMFLISLTPIILAGKNTFVNEYLEICNIDNITGDVEINYPFFNREDVLDRDPEIIIHTQENITSTDDLIEAYPEWTSLTAIKNDRVYYVDPDLFHRPGPRFAEAAKILFNKLNN